MTTTALTSQADVFKFPLPDTEAVYFDEGRAKDRAPGLALRIRAAGSRKWVFFYRYGGRLLKLTIGDAASWPLDKARKVARDLRVKVDGGENPSTDKATRRVATALVFSAVKADYLKSRQSTMKARYYVECERHLNRDWKPFDKLPIASIDRATVAARLRALTQAYGAVSANRARSTLSTMFGWAIGEGLCEANPVTGTNKAAEVGSRDRVLSDAELGAIWNNATPDTDYGMIVRLLMLTGQRREEIGGLAWSEVTLTSDNPMIALPASRTKNSRPHDVPLSAAAVAVFKGLTNAEKRPLVFGRGDAGFSGWSKSKAVMDSLVKIPDWRLHDLRRTAATRMADLGVQPHVIEAALNHISGHKAGVAGIYNRSTYSVEKRAALDLWANHVIVAVAKASGANVTRIRGRKT